MASPSLGVGAESFIDPPPLPPRWKTRLPQPTHSLCTLHTAAHTQPVCKPNSVLQVQFHPEKVQFEWQSPNIPHSAAAVASNAYLAQFLVQEARRNTNRFASPEAEAASLVYNYVPTYCARYGPFHHFDQCYLF